MLGKICDIGKYLAAYATPALALLPLVQAHVLHVAHVVSKGLGTEVAAEGHDSGFFIAVRLFVAVFPFCVPPQSRKRGKDDGAEGAGGLLVASLEGRWGGGRFLFGWADPRDQGTFHRFCLLLFRTRLCFNLGFLNNKFSRKAPRIFTDG